MVKLEYRSYLFVLFGLTVCVSLYEIAYVQWINQLAPTTTTINSEKLDAVPVALSIKENFPAIAINISKRTAHNVQKNRKGNREILSSGRIINTEVATDNVLPVTLVDQRLPKNDFQSLIDLDFDFLINQSPCPGPKSKENLLVLVLVHSAPRNFRKRLTIRQTWASHPDPGMRVYFLMGSVDTPALQMKLEMENEMFGDLIQGNFLDAYRNMTYKHIMAFKWFNYFCKDTPVLLKTDDDVFVNSPALMQYVREDVDGARTRQKLVKCLVLKDGKVKRSYRSKWRVSVREYPHDRYPPYCPGFIVLYSRDMVGELYREAQRSRYFWIDDVHVTGTLMEKLNVSLTPFRETFFPLKNRKRLTEPYVRNLPLFTSPDLKEDEIRHLWRIVEVVQHMRNQEDEKRIEYWEWDELKSGGRRLGDEWRRVYGIVLVAVLGGWLGGILKEFSYIAGR